jgi:hypothetical protein
MSLPADAERIADASLEVLRFSFALRTQTTPPARAI